MNLAWYYITCANCPRKIIINNNNKSNKKRFECSQSTHTVSIFTQNSIFDLYSSIIPKTVGPQALSLVLWISFICICASVCTSHFNHLEHNSLFSWQQQISMSVPIHKFLREKRINNITKTLETTFRSQ